MWYHLRRRLHPTWHFTLCCLGIIAGVVIARYSDIFSHVGWLVFAGILIGAAMIKRWRVLLILAFVAGICIGGWRGSIEQAGLSRYTPMIGKHVVLTGVVDGDMEEGKRGGAVKLRDVRQGSQSLTGTIRVTLAEHGMIRRSDKVTVDGKLDAGFGTFAATMRNAKIIRQERNIVGDPALALRDNFSHYVQASVQGSAASLGSGYLLGQKQALPQDLQDALVVTGLTHVVVASGYNLTILVRLARRIFARISKYLAALSSVAMVGGFIAVTGLSPSMTRAGLVSLLGVWAWYYGRKFHPVTLLSFVAAVTVLWNPSYAWGDIGWLLSFTAFAGVMILAPLLQAYFYGEKKPSFIGQTLGETFAAHVVTAPIILVVFGQFSNIAILSNLIILPFIPLAMLLTFVAGIGAWLTPGVAHIVGWPAQTLLDAMIWVINWTASVPGAQSKFSLPLWGVAVCYVALVGICLYLSWRTKHRLRETSIVE